MHPNKQNGFKFLVILVIMAMLLTGCQKATPQASPTDAPKEAATQAPVKQEPPKVEPTQVPASGEASGKPVIVVALDSDIDNLEPTFFKTDSAYYLVDNTGIRLLRENYKQMDENGNVLVGNLTFGPEAAESMEYSADGRCATFKIRKGLKLNDGTPITAKSFKYSIDRALLGPGYAASLLSLGGVKDPSEITAKDDDTLQVCSDIKTPMFEALFSFNLMPALDEAVSKKNATAEDPWAAEWYRTNIAGGGPYILKEWTPGDQYVVEPNSSYWRGEDYFQNSKIVFKLIPNPQDRELLLKSGGVDLAIGIPFKDVDDLKKDPNVKIAEIPYSRVRFLGWNNKIAPFDDVKVRQAMMYAIPYETILEKAVYGHGRPARSIIPSDWETSDQDYSPYKYDPEKAKTLLKEAGKESFDVELAVRLSIPEDVEAATWIQSALSEIGVNVTVNKMNDAQFFDKINKHELAFFIHDWYSWLHDPYYQFNWLARCDMGTNYVDYCNPKFDELFQKGLYEQDTAKRAEISKQLQHIWLDDAPWAPLYHPNWIIGTTPTFKGFVVEYALMLQYGFMTK